MSKIFRGGIPYAIDVRRLDETFPADSLSEGRLLSHEDLEGVLRCPRGTGRYYAVVNSWIRKVRNSCALFLVWEPTKGVRVLNPAEILGHAETRTLQKLRQTGKAIGLFRWVPGERLNPVGQERFDRAVRITEAQKASLERMRRDLAIDLAPVKSLPKPQIVKAG